MNDVRRFCWEWIEPVCQAGNGLELLIPVDVSIGSAKIEQKYVW